MHKTVVNAIWRQDFKSIEDSSDMVPAIMSNIGVLQTLVNLDFSVDATPNVHFDGCKSLGYVVNAGSLPVSQCENYIRHI